LRDGSLEAMTTRPGAGAGVVGVGRLQDERDSERGLAGEVHGAILSDAILSGKGWAVAPLSGTGGARGQRIGELYPGGV
jgi:hypothetical protein